MNYREEVTHLFSRIRKLFGCVYQNRLHFDCPFFQLLALIINNICRKTRSHIAQFSSEIEVQFHKENKTKHKNDQTSATAKNKFIVFYFGFTSDNKTTNGSTWVFVSRISFLVPLHVKLEIKQFR